MDEEHNEAPPAPAPIPSPAPTPPTITPKSTAQIVGETIVDVVIAAGIIAGILTGKIHDGAAIIAALTFLALIAGVRVSDLLQALQGRGPGNGGVTGLLLAAGGALAHALSRASGGA